MDKIKDWYECILLLKNLKKDFGGIMVIRDAIHGDMEFSQAEMRIIESSPFRRMRYIKQLAFAEYVYPCASHNRYQHSLGVAQCITDMYTAICKNCPSFYREGDLELLRAMALIHDLGHPPFSHASEELSTIEHEERLTDILESIKKEIIIPNNYGIESWRLVNEVYQGIGMTYMSDRHLIALHSLMDGFIDADKLDYLERDALNCGVKYGNFDRQDLISNLTMVNDKIAILPEGINALESFILARYYMFSKVYMHPEERIMRLMYCKEMKDILKGGTYPESVKKFLALDDTNYIHKLKCIKDNNYVLIYDGNFDAEFKASVDRLLSDYLICDCPRKSLFRQSEDDQVIEVYNKDTDTSIPCTELSPLLKSLEFQSFHKLRYYVRKEIEQEVKQEFRKVVNCYNENKK